MLNLKSPEAADRFERWALGLLIIVALMIGPLLLLLAGFKFPALFVT